MVAVVPTAILRRWDALAAVQLCAAASALAEQNDALEQRCDALERRCALADDAAEFWRENAFELANDEGRPGLTITGHLVRA